MLEAEKQRLVVPFYMRMMRTNVVGEAGDLAKEVAALAHTLRPADVVELLRSDWRPRVMGAWFAVARTDEGIGGHVLTSLDTCLGSLTSPPLVIAALIHRGPGTGERLMQYVERDRANGWGAAGFALAGVEQLGAPLSPDLPATDRDRSDLSAMLAFAALLRGS